MTFDERQAATHNAHPTTPHMQSTCHGHCTECVIYGVHCLSCPSGTFANASTPVASQGDGAAARLQAVGPHLGQPCAAWQHAFIDLHDLYKASNHEGRWRVLDARVVFQVTMRHQPAFDPNVCELDLGAWYQANSVEHADHLRAAAAFHAPYGQRMCRAGGPTACGSCPSGTACGRRPYLPP